MATGLRTLVERLRGAVGRDGLATASDAELIRRYADQRDDVAFAELVHRHAPAVYAMCRRHLVDPASLDDAFQATFVLLAKKAGTLAKPEKLSAWLCGVADRVARTARKRAAKRGAKERSLDSVAEPSIPAECPETDLRTVLDDELAKLPPEYREAITLCDVDGVSRRAAAKRLGIPDGTLSNRVTRARALLGRRLLRRGVTLGAGLSLSSVSIASVPAKLVSYTVSNIASDTVPMHVAALATEGIKMAFPIRTLTAVLAGLCIAGVSLVSLSAREPVKAPPVAKKAADVEPPDPEPEVVTGWAPAAAYSRDGKRLALTLSEAKTVTLYDTATWKPVHTLEGLKHLSHVVVFSADGKTLYAACYDGLIYTWDTKTGKAGATLDAKVGPCTGLVLSPDGKRLASGHHDSDGNKTAIQIWDTATGKAVRTITADDQLLPNSIAFTPDGKTIAGGYHATHKDGKDLGGFHGVIEWDVATGKEVKRFDTPRVTPGASPVVCMIAYTTDGKRVIVGGGEAVPIASGNGCWCVGYLWVFDRETGKVEKTLIGNSRSDYVRQVCLSADGTNLFVTTHTPMRQVVRNGRRFHTVFTVLQCWDTAAWELDWTHEYEATTPTAIATAPNGKRVGVSDTNNGFNLFDAKTGEPKGGLVKVKDR